MKHARVSSGCGWVAVGACLVAAACGSRNGVDTCAYGVCARSHSPARGEAGDGGDGGDALAAGGTADPATGGSVSTGGTTGGANTGGTTGGSGNAGGGGAAGEGGSSGALGQAGDSGAGGNAGAGAGGDAGASGEAGAGGSAEQPPPAVLLLVDGSFSMFAPSVWEPTYEALAGAGGPIERYQDRVRFGFASYRGPGQVAEDDPACAEITSVPFALDNSNSIRETYGALDTRRGYWETPTGHAIVRVTQDLAAEPADIRKYIFLISDGAPDTCFTTTPPCGQDRAVFAVQEAFRAGIETRAIGLGYGREYDCDPEVSRCGARHFQDLANAGRGLNVLAPPDAYTTLPCVAETGGELLAEYAGHGALAPFSWAMTPEEVRSAFEGMLKEIIER